MFFSSSRLLDFFIPCVNLLINCTTNISTLRSPSIFPQLAKLHSVMLSELVLDWISITRNAYDNFECKWRKLESKWNSLNYHHHLFWYYHLLFRSLLEDLDFIKIPNVNLPLCWLSLKGFSWIKSFKVLTGLVFLFTVHISHIII